MAKAENKTQPTEADPVAFITSVEHNTRRQDAESLLSLFNRVTGLEPKMWGPSIIGYGRYAYKYESGREDEFLLTGFSPRKQNLSLYIMSGYRAEHMQDRLSELGKHKTSKACLYINKLADVDLTILEDIIRSDLAYMRQNYETWDT